MIKRLLFIPLLFIATTVFAGALLPYPLFQAIDGNGNPIRGGKLYSYEAGTSTLKDTYSDRALTTPNDNPLILSSEGQAVVYTDGEYKFNLLDRNSRQMPDWPVDNVFGMGGAYNYVSLDETYSCDLAAAITGIGATETTLLIDCTSTIANGITDTIPATTTLQYVRGGLIQGTAGGGTETLAYANGTSPPLAPWNQNIYGANLTVTYGTSIAEAFPEHFGSIDGTSDEVQINLAITALNKGDVVLNGQSYTVDASITGATNVNLRGREGITTINIGTADIDAFSATSKTNITISGIKWNGSGANADTERLVFFDTCTDVHSRNNIYTNSIIGLQFQTCTRGSSVDDTFTSILRKTDFSQGYGVLANLDNDDIKVLHGSFNAVARHCIYFTSGSSNCTADSNIAKDSTGAPFVAASTSAQNTMRNISFTNNKSDGIQTAGGGTDDVFGILGVGNIDGFIATNNELYDNEVGGGIFLQHGSADANTFKSATILGNIIDGTVGGHGIWVLNGAKILITNNQAKNIDTVADAFSGILASVSGTGVGSFLDEVIIKDNIIDTGKYNISITGVSAVYQATNIILGDNLLSNANTSTFNMSDVDYITYKTTWDTLKPDFYVNNAAAAQTDTVMTAGNGSGYSTNGVFIAPFSGWLYSAYGRVSGTITNEAIILELRQNGANRANGVTISAGDLYEKEIFKIGTRAITEGDTIQMIYTTAAGYLPVTLEVVGGFEIIRDINQ